MCPTQSLWLAFASALLEELFWEPLATPTQTWGQPWEASPRISTHLGHITQHSCPQEGQGRLSAG